MRPSHTRAVIGMLALAVVSTGIVAADAHAQAALAPPPDSAAADSTSVELAALYRADQADRSPGPGAPRDFFVGLEMRDAARQQRVMTLHEAGRLRTSADFFHAAMILQHGPGTEAPLLAHELALAALASGEPRARWLAAASLDRFLLRIGRPQRFGTQSRFETATERFVLDSVVVGPAGVTDGMRAALRVPPLAELRARVQESNRRIEAQREAARGAKPSAKPAP